MPGATASSASNALDEVSAAVRAGDLAAARRLAGEALVRGEEHPLLLNLRALDHEEAGRLDAALADLVRAHALAPQDFSILNALGLCLARMGRAEEALGRFEAALAIRPDFAPAWFNKAAALEQTGEVAAAAEAYARSAELEPRNAQAFANLAWLAARRGDDVATRDAADRALALHPANATAALALASVELADPAAAERRLRGLLNRSDLGAYDRAIALGLLGDALDALDRPPEAFAAYAEGNDLLRAEAGPRFDGAASVADVLRWIVPWTETIQPAAAGNAQPADEMVLSPVFLLGFPRTGTTLAESALAAHPGVVSLEERNTLEAGVRAFMGDAVSLANLWRASDADLAPYREDYWRCVRNFGVDPTGKVFIDKNPFNTLKIPLIHRLFPRARYVFAVRDPRDVVLSCYRRRFNLNPSTFELLDLKRTAAFYDGAMRMAENLRGALGLAWRPLIYERLVADFEGEMRALCDFIGVDWRPELAQFADRARRGGVASASAGQIARGLYADGAGQWRRYRTQLEPVLDVLAPWVARFGYPAD
jgi:tetratricopeptide (TPR) repeat protein